MGYIETFLNEFDHEAATTRKLLERLPDGQLDFRPHPKSFTMGALATHIVNMLNWAVVTVKQDSFDYAPEGAEPYKEEPLPSSAAAVQKFDESLAGFRAAVRASSEEAMQASWSLLAGGKPVMTMPRGAVLRGMILNHIIHHRGQLSVYLRMCDVPVPAIYGPSADES
jgi:uncharacterized damage-inducible protein DinB